MVPALRTINDSPEEFHIPDILIIRPASGSDLAKNFFSQAGRYGRIHGEEIYYKGQR